MQKNVSKILAVSETFFRIKTKLIQRKNIFWVHATTSIKEVHLPELLINLQKNEYR